MNFVKDGKATIEALDDLIDEIGMPQHIAECIDGVIFDYLNFALREGACTGNRETDRFIDLKSIRDFFMGIEIKDNELTSKMQK